MAPAGERKPSRRVPTGQPPFLVHQQAPRPAKPGAQPAGGRWAIERAGLSHGGARRPGSALGRSSAAYRLQVSGGTRPNCAAGAHRSDSPARPAPSRRLDHLGRRNSGCGFGQQFRGSVMGARRRGGRGDGAAARFPRLTRPVRFPRGNLTGRVSTVRRANVSWERLRGPRSPQNHLVRGPRTS